MYYFARIWVNTFLREFILLVMVTYFYSNVRRCFQYLEIKGKLTWKREMLNPCRSDPGRRDKINLNFYFHTSFWCLKSFYEGLKVLCYLQFLKNTKCGRIVINHLKYLINPVLLAKAMRILRLSGVFYLNLPFLLQWYKPK